MEVIDERLRLVLLCAHPTLAPESAAAPTLLQHSRREARVGSDGGLVLLSDQDRRRWYAGEIDEAVALLSSWVHAPGTAYLLQTLIAAEHALAADAASTDWPRICERYAKLEELTGSPVVRLNHAVARAEADGPEAGLRMLEGLDLPGHRLPAARAELLLRSGAAEAARVSFREAIDLCANAAESDHLVQRLSCCS